MEGTHVSRDNRHAQCEGIERGVRVALAHGHLQKHIAVQVGLLLTSLEDRDIGCRGTRWANAQPYKDDTHLTKQVADAIVAL